MGRGASIRGVHEEPTVFFMVSNGRSFYVYKNKGTARGQRTRLNNQIKRWSSHSNIPEYKVYEGVISDEWREVE